MFRSLLRWLGLDAPRSVVGLRPHRTVEMPCSFEDAYARALAAMDAVLGANVRDADPVSGIIDAEFGMIGSERIRAAVESGDATHSRVHIEARYIATAVAPTRSLAVDALAEALAKDR